MKALKTYGFFIFLLFLLEKGAAQTTPIIQDETNASASGSANASDYAELLENYIKHPININRANRGMFAELQLLTPIQVNAILTHRLNYGDFLSLLELQSLPGFSVETIKKILPYLAVEENAIPNVKTVKNLLKTANHSVILYYEQPLQTAQGFKNGSDSNSTNDYLGQNFKTNIRYRYTNGSKLSMGFNADKDLGEPFFNSSQPRGFDFYTAHLFAKDMGLLKQIAIGDYHLSIGQGLGIGTGFVINKSIEVLQVHRYAAGLRPYRSMNEFGFLRGAAATIGTEKISTTIYTSIKKVDGNTVVTDTALFASERYYNLIQTGYHRTARELALKHTSTQKIFGGYIQTQVKNFHAGVGYVNQQLAATQQVVHADFTYTAANYSWFGEGASNAAGGRALLIGGMASLNKDLDMAIIYRNYNNQFNNTLSNAFSNSASPSNEKGIYLGGTLKLNKSFRLLCYADFFNSPYSKYRTNGPSYGHDYASAIQYQPSKSFKLEMRYRVMVDQLNVPSREETTVGYLINEQRSTLRLQCDYSNGKEWVFKTRFEQTLWNNEIGEKQSGNLIFQDLHYTASNGKWGAIFRYCLFNSSGANARMYTFENDVPYTFSIAQLSGIGSRFYLMANYRFNRRSEVWVRYSNSFFPDEEIVGSGLDKIQSHKRESIKVLLKINF